MALNRELITRWIAALRSGKYVQGRGLLRKYDHYSKTSRYCCLGVLADICEVKWENNSGEIFFIEGISKILPINIIELSGIEYLQDRLIKMNDANGLSFDQIADFLEDELKHDF